MYLLISFLMHIIHNINDNFFEEFSNKEVTLTGELMMEVWIKVATIKQKDNQEENSDEV